MNNPVKGDWVATCINDLKELKIAKKKLEGNENMSRIEFKNMRKGKNLINAIKYLKSKEGSEGQDIQYTAIEIADNLQPFNTN